MKHSACNRHVKVLLYACMHVPFISICMLHSTYYINSANNILLNIMHVTTFMTSTAIPMIVVNVYYMYLYASVTYATIRFICS